MAQEMKSGRGTVLKSNFEVSSTIDAFYTGGKVQFSHNEDHLFCTCNDKVQVLHVESGKVVQTLREEGDVVSCFAASPDDEFVVTASKSLLLRQWDWKNGQQLRTWKAVHRAPIASMVFDSTSTLLATGSSDSTVKVWDIIKQYYTHNFTGSQGVVSLVCFHPDPKRLQLFSTSDDCKIRIWDLKSSRCAAVLESHFSVVTSLAFSLSGETLISSSRDNVLNVWDLTERRLLKTIPAFEGVESVIMLPKGVVCPGCEEQEKEYFMTAGSKGKLRVWSVESGKCVFTQPVLHIKESDSTESNATEDSLLIVHAALCETLGMVAVVTFDHNVVLHELETLKKTKQFVGYNDEILDLCFAGVEESHLAVATNSSQLRMYNLSTMNCQLLEGHTDIVLTLDINTAGDMLVTGSKDNTIRIWQMSEKSEFRCVAVGKGHTHAVATVAWSRLTNSFVASGSQDCTIKIWSVPQTSEDDLGSPVKLSVRLTEKAHEKDINSVTVSPNDKLLASGSQDKTAKIWIIADGSLLGTLRGHKKGIWCVRFSPVDQCVATSSADSTVKIWALSDLACVKTFEGHTSSVLRVTFVTKGMQLISSGSEGLLKLWTIKTNECVQTFDQHLDKVWSITVDKSQDRLVSGGADSVINIWKDVTEIEQEQAQAAVEENIMKQQKLSNLIADKKYVEAISLAITLEQPFRVMGIMKDILCVENGTEELTTAVKSMRKDQLDTILRFLVEWNTNSKNCHVAQTILSIILKTVSPYELKNRPNMKGTIEALIPYSEKHFQRMNRLLQQMEFIEYTWQSMRLSGPLLGASQTVGLATQATSTSDTDTEARHTTTADNFQELGTSSQNPVSPSSPDPSPTMASPDLPHTNGNGKAGSDSEESDTKENNVDQNGASDLEIEETFSPGLNGEDLFELNREDEEMRGDVEKKNRKTKKTMESEVATLLKKKAKLKKLKQGNVKRKIKTGADKTVKIKRKTRTT